jgi:glycosyltransferase 2 family protein
MQKGFANWHKYFIYLSLIFLVLFLYRMDYLKMPVVHSPITLVFSLLLLFLGFLADTFSWKKTLQMYGVNVVFAQALSSTGLSVFGKYMPGKLWAILGRAGLISKHGKGTTSEISAIALSAQILSIVCGLILGMVALIIFSQSLSYIFLSIAAILGLFVGLGSKKVKEVGELLLSKILKKDILLPHIDFRQNAVLMPYFFLTWILWSIGFLFLVKSLVNYDVEIGAALVYPIAAVFGILALFAPGGLGVREGIMALLLKQVGVELSDAALISIASRLWSLSGELLLFSSGVFSSVYFKTQEE